MSDPRGVPLVGDRVTATGVVRTVEALGTSRLRVTLDTPVETEGVEIHRPPHWLEEIDRIAPATPLGRHLRDAVVELVGRVTAEAYDAGVADTERRLLPEAPLDQVAAARGRVIGHLEGTPLVAHQQPSGRILIDGISPTYFAPATADPSQVPLEGRYRVDGPTVDFEIRPRRPGDVPRIEDPSPIRAYLNRHAEDALVERGIAEERIVDATRDFETVVERQVMIQRALDDLGDLEGRAADAAEIFHWEADGLGPCPRCGNSARHIHKGAR